MIRLNHTFNLIFFVFIFLSSCNRESKEEITIVWNNDQATGISIPGRLVDEDHRDSINSLLQVRLKNAGSVAMLGEYSIDDNKIVFRPLIPLSRGLEYEIFFRNKQIGKITIPRAKMSDAPVLVIVYPTPDTLPENLLKLYLQFSRPMREGESQKNITLLNGNNDTIRGVFLDLEPELWNKERNILTIWLDPGRIKRGLIPNEQQGNPLKRGENYTLCVSRNWRDVQGLQLRQNYTRQFIVGPRDSQSPDPGQWTLNLPAAESVQSLKIDFAEPLDYFLLLETIHIVNDNGKRVPGKIRISDKERQFEFIPDEKWLRGPYSLQVASYLEDVAGNNLNRVFDRDTRVKNLKVGKEVFERGFVIGE